MQRPTQLLCSALLCSLSQTLQIPRTGVVLLPATSSRRSHSACPGTKGKTDLATVTGLLEGIIVKTEILDGSPTDRLVVEVLATMMIAVQADGTMTGAGTRGLRERIIPEEDETTEAVTEMAVGVTWSEDHLAEGQAALMADFVNRESERDRPSDRKSLLQTWRP